MGQSRLSKIVNAYNYIHSFYHTICYMSTYYIIIYIGSKLIRKQFTLHTSTYYTFLLKVCYLSWLLLCVQIYDSLQQHTIVHLVICAQFHPCIHIPAGDDHWPSLATRRIRTRRIRQFHWFNCCIYMYIIDLCMNTPTVIPVNAMQISVRERV